MPFPPLPRKSNTPEIDIDSLFTYLQRLRSETFDEVTTIVTNTPGSVGPPGPQGPTGPQGPQGIQGPPGTSSSLDVDNILVDVLGSIVVSLTGNVLTKV